MTRRRHRPTAGVSAVLLSVMAIGSAQAIAGGGGGKKPPKDPPPDPDPAIVFHSGSTIYVMNADGSNVSVIVGDTGVDLFTQPDPRWSPDGSQIVFIGDLPPYGLGLYIVNADGTGLTFLTPAPFITGNPDWSPVPTPDGRYKILFDVFNDITGESDIYAINPDGTGRVNLTNTLYRDEWQGLSWAPTGDAFVCAVDTYEGSSQIDECIVYGLGLLDGQLAIISEVSITDIPGSPLQGWTSPSCPDWSHGGDRVALSAYTDQIWVIDLADPANPLHLTAGVRWTARMPAWSPDDSMIAFRKGGRGQDGIFVVGTDGSAPQGLTSFGTSPDWR